MEKNVQIDAFIDLFSSQFQLFCLRVIGGVHQILGTWCVCMVSVYEYEIYVIICMEFSHLQPNHARFKYFHLDVANYWPSHVCGGGLPQRIDSLSHNLTIKISFLLFPSGQHDDAIYDWGVDSFCA